MPGDPRAFHEQNKRDANLPQRGLPASDSLPEQRVLRLLRILLLHGRCVTDGRELRRRSIYSSRQGNCLGSWCRQRRAQTGAGRGRWQKAMCSALAALAGPWLRRGTVTAEAAAPPVSRFLPHCMDCTAIMAPTRNSEILVRQHPRLQAWAVSSLGPLTCRFLAGLI